jgi:hypothetical protein
VGPDSAKSSSIALPTTPQNIAIQKVNKNTPSCPPRFHNHLATHSHDPNCITAVHQPGTRAHLQRCLLPHQCATTITGSSTPKYNKPLAVALVRNQTTKHPFTPWNTCPIQPGTSTRGQGTRKSPAFLQTTEPGQRGQYKNPLLELGRNNH